jgi:hypothetical protein
MSDSQQNTALVVEDELFIVLEIEEIVQHTGHFLHCALGSRRRVKMAEN